MSEEMVWYPDLDHAFVGLVMRGSVLEPIACYDYDAVIAGYVEEGMSEEEAVGHFEYNVIGTWIGERTPCFIRQMPITQARDEAEE